MNERQAEIDRLNDMLLGYAAEIKECNDSRDFDMVNFLSGLVLAVSSRMIRLSQLGRSHASDIQVGVRLQTESEQD